VKDKKLRSKKDEDQAKVAYPILGELVLLSSALDYLVTQVLIVVLDLGESPLLEPVVTTLDVVRKVEILKGRAAHMPRGTWQNDVTKFCDKIESVFKQRNIACHTPPAFKAGVWTLKPVAAAKMFRNLDLPAKEVRPFRLNDLKVAISTGEAVFAAGLTLIENFKRVNAEGKSPADARVVGAGDMSPKKH
jgi:hypothetical protein